MLSLLDLCDILQQPQTPGSTEEIIQYQVRWFRECFTVFDRDFEGTISSEEIMYFFRRSMGQRPTVFEVTSCACDDANNDLNAMHLIWKSAHNRSKRW